MPAQSKKVMLADICESVQASKGLFVVDYRGLTVKESEELRRALRQVGASMKVYKNTLVRRALAQCDQPAIDDLLEETNAFVFFEKDPVEAAKVIKEKMKTLKKLTLKGGIADGQALNAEQAEEYANLASREELLAQLVYVIASPLSGIVSVCAGPARGLVTVLDAIAEQKQETQEAA